MFRLGNDAIDCLRNLPLFSALDDKAMQRIIAGASEVDAPRGTILLRCGDACRGIYVVARGRVKLSLETRQGDEKVMELLGERTWFGDTLMYSRESCIATAESLVDSTLLCVARDTILHEITANLLFAQRVIEDLSRRLYQRTKDIESYTLKSGTERFIDYLLGEELGGAVNGVRQVVLPERKGIIASRLNLTHEHFSRILRDLATRKLIQVKGARVTIPDVSRLRGVRV